MIISTSPRSMRRCATWNSPRRRKRRRRQPKRPPGPSSTPAGRARGAAGKARCEPCGSATAARTCGRWSRRRATFFLIFFFKYWLIFGKLWEACSRLYRRQILQVNTRLKALDEIYKIYKLLHRSEFKNSATFRQTFSYIFAFLQFHLQNFIHFP